MASERSGSPPEWLPLAKRHIEGVPVFLIDDAALCFGHTCDAHGGKLDHRTLPPATMPFPHFWLEWRPLGLDDMPLQYPEDISFMRYGADCQWDARTNLLHVALIGTTIANGEPSAGILTGLQFVYDADRLCVQHFARVPRRTMDILATSGKPITTDTFSGEAGAILMALALLSAKNVRREDGGMPRVIRRHQPLFAATATHRHHVLVVPGASELRSAIGAGHGTARGLHIVKGHWSNYTEGGGLFGKLHGWYYIAPHTRGNAALGVITKDYRVVSATPRVKNVVG